MATTVSGKDIIEYTRSQFDYLCKLSEEELSQTVGGLNGIDMVIYNRGYVDALNKIISFFETRV